MKTILLAALALTLTSPLLAFPTMEPFATATAAGGTSYANGAPLYYQTNASGDWWARWNGGNLTQDIPCTNTGLSYSGYPGAFPVPSLTNAAYVPGNDDHGGGISGQQAALIFSKIIKADPNNQVVNTIYASFLIQVPTMGTLATNATYFAGFATNDATSDNEAINLPNSAMKIFLRGNSPNPGSSTSWGIGVANNSGQAAAAWDAGGHVGSTVLFVVVDYEFGINGGSDFARLWVNPASSAFGANTPPTATASTAGITSGNRIAQAADFFLQDRTSSTMWGKIILADLRVGTTWSFVTGGPEITAPPANLTAGAGTMANFTIGAVTGSTNNPLTYQWRKNGANLSNGGAISGATSASLTVSGLVQTNSATYSVVVANALGAVTNSAVLTVIDPYIAPQPPSVLNVPTGTAAVFIAGAAGTASLSQHWFKNGALLPNGTTASGSVVSGAATTSLTISGAQPADSGAYTLSVTNGTGSVVVSSNSVLTVNDPIVVAPPQSVSTNYLGSASFSATAGGTPPFGYQWKFNGVNLTNGPAPSGSGALIAGSQTTNLIISGVAFADGGNYSLLLSNATNSFASPPGVLTVADPYIVSPPASQNDPGGTTASFSVAAAGSGHPTYQWKRNGTSLSDNGAISGSSTASLQIANIGSTNAGSYTVVVSGAGPAVTSSAATLTVIPDVLISPTTPLVTNFQGWGCSLCWWANILGGFPNREYYADLAFKTLKLNVVRYNIGGGENPNIPNTEDYYAIMPGFEPSPGVWDWTADANQRWILQAALARGVNHVEAFANSPPYWMTVSGSVTGSHGGTNNLQVAEETTFATYLATVISNLTALDGVHFDYVTPMNEPAGGWSFGNYQEGCHMDVDQQARLVNDLRVQLNAQGLSTGIDASESSSEALELTSLPDYDNYGYTPPPQGNVNLVSLHTYGNTDPTDCYKLAVSMGTPMWMTEYGNTDPSGMILARRIHDDMTQLRPNAWICWQFVKNDSHTSWGLLYNPLVAATNSLYTTNSIIHESFYVMAQFSEYVSPGSVILNAGDNYTLAAYNITNQTLALVTINDGNSDFSEALDLTAFDNLPASASLIRTSITESNAPLPALAVVNHHLVNIFPAQSITTAVLTNVTVPPLKFNSISRSQLQLSWGMGWLQASTNLSGPFGYVTNVSPFSISPTNAQQFFRVKMN